MIQLEHLTKRFGSFTAVDDLNLSIAEGEIFGFLGPNGAGKTTTIRMMMGLLKPTSGRIVLGGRDLAVEPLEVSPGHPSRRAAVGRAWQEQCLPGRA